MGTASEQPEQDDPVAHVPPGASRAKVLGYLSALTLLVLGADQASKIIALEQLNPGEYYPLLGDLFGLRLVFNPGAAFSLASGLTWVFTMAAVVVTVVIIAVAPRLRSFPWASGLGLLLGGNLGNLVDRLFREPSFAQGHVVDFLSYGGLFIGNVADIAIVAGAPLIAVLMIRGTGLDGARADAESASTETTAAADTQDTEDAEPGDRAGAADAAEQQTGTNTAPPAALADQRAPDEDHD